MSDSNRHIALLIFSRTIKEEAEIKQFAGRNAHQNSHKSIAEALFNKSILLGKQSGLPTFLSLSNEQKGNSFGERIANEAQTIFNKGFKKLIIIGSDCPDLTTTQISEAASILRMGKATVVGPAHDRGAYLLGLESQQFDINEFKQLPWQTGSLLHEWNKLYEQTIYLDYLNDIDSAKDLKFYLSKAYSNNRFQKLLVFLLIKDLGKQTFHNNRSSGIQKHHQFHFFRGPPTLV